jgi:hypothetical protein
VSFGCAAQEARRRCTVAAHKALVTRLLFILTRCSRLVLPDEATPPAQQGLGSTADYGATALYTQPRTRGGRWRRFHGGGGGGAVAGWATAGVGPRAGAPPCSAVCVLC